MTKQDGFVRSFCKKCLKFSKIDLLDALQGLCDLRTSRLELVNMNAVKFVLLYPKTQRK